MAEAFNPYHQWLGIRDAKRLPSHYRLLGLDPEENDPHIIANAGDGVIARVRSYRPGNHVVEWQELLDDLMAAKLCLLDPERKQRYDIELRAALSEQKPSSSTPLEPIGVTPIGSLSADDASNGAAPRLPAGDSPGLGFMWPPGLEPPGTTRADTAQASGEPQRAASNTAPVTAANPSSPSGGNAAPTAGVKFPSDYAAASAPVASVVAPNVVAPPSMPPMSFVPGAGATFNPMAPNPMAPVTSNLPPGMSPTMGYPAGPSAMGSNLMAPNPMAPIAAPVGPMNWPPGSYPGMAVGNAPLMPQPVMSQPVMAQPMMAQPVMVQSILQPVMSQPIMAQPVVSQPIAQAVTSQAVVALPVQSQPVIPQARMISPADVPNGIETGPNAQSGSSVSYRKSFSKRSSSVPAAAVGVAILLIVVAVGLALTNPNKVPPNKDHVAALSPNSKPKPQPSSKPRINPDANSKAKLQTYTSSAPREQPDRPENVDLVSLDPQDPTAPAPEAMPAADPEPQAVGDEKPTPEEKATSDPAPPPEVPVTPEPAPPDPEAKPSQDQEMAWRKAMAETLRALGEHNLSAAQTQLQLASKAAVSTKQKDRVEGLRTVSEGVQNYWNAVSESLKGLQAGDEILIGTTRAAVVESSEDTLIIHVAGKNRRYDVKNLSMGIANFLAQRWFDASAPSTSVSLGAVQFVDPNGDRAEAKRLWEEAGSKGQQVDHLLPLLNENFSAPASEADLDEKS